jgi:hypothetical protein
MSLRNRVHDTALASIGGFHLAEDFVVEWADKDKELLFSLLNTGAVTREEVANAVHGRLLILGRKSLQVQSEGYSCPTFSHHAIAYVLSFGGLSDLEESLVRYDNVKTREEFITQYSGRELKDRIIAQLLGEPSPSPQKQFFEDVSWGK